VLVATSREKLASLCQKVVTRQIRLQGSCASAENIRAPWNSSLRVQSSEAADHGNRAAGRWPAMVCSLACSRAQLDESRSRAVSASMSGALFDDNLKDNQSLGRTEGNENGFSGQRITEKGEPMNTALDISCKALLFLCLSCFGNRAAADSSYSVKIA